MVVVPFSYTRNVTRRGMDCCASPQTLLLAGSTRTAIPTRRPRRSLPPTVPSPRPPSPSPPRTKRRRMTRPPTTVSSMSGSSPIGTFAAPSGTETTAIRAKRTRLDLSPASNPSHSFQRARASARPARGPPRGPSHSASDRATQPLQARATKLRSGPSAQQLLAPLKLRRRPLTRPKLMIRPHPRTHCLQAHTKTRARGARSNRTLPKFTRATIVKCSPKSSVARGALIGRGLP